MGNKQIENDQVVAEVRAELAAFLQESMMIMEKFEKVDWKKVDVAEKVSVEFKSVLDDFQSNFQQAFKRWRQNNADLQSKYENVSVWVNEHNEISTKLKDEFLQAQKSNLQKF